MSTHRNDAFFRFGRLVAACIAVPMLFAASSSAAEPLDPFTQNERIGRSVNIIGYDPIWKSVDQARFKARHFQLIKQAGFNSVRINLAPFRAMDANNDNQLSDAWLKVLDWAVRGALDNNLAVILDCHEHNALGNDPEGNHERFLAFWRQIAPRFRDASSNVIFELLNEPTRKLSPELWNTYLAESLALVRQSNPTRTVIIGPGNGNGFNALDRLKLPENDRNIIVTIHYYFPMAFTHQGAPFSAANRDKTGVEWLGTPREQQDIVQNFGQSQAWAKANNRPIFLGEFGAYDKAPMESRARYTAFVCRTAEKLGWSWAYWQLDSDFILYNIEEDRWVEPIRNALIPR